MGPDQAPAGSGKDIVAFWVRRDTKCEQCGAELLSGSALTFVGGKAMCLTCADLDHLVFLPTGDAALTRRSRKYSKLWVVVVKWSRARKRYERQGLFVEEEALEQAEAECLADADLRERRRQREEWKRLDQDQEYHEQFAQAVRRQYPAAPEGVERRIADHACMKYSGRVGRSAAAKELDPEAVTLAVLAHIRHALTDYDKLLLAGMDRQDARDSVRSEVDEIEGRWQG